MASVWVTLLRFFVLRSNRGNRSLIVRLSFLLLLGYSRIVQKVLVHHKIVDDIIVTIIVVVSIDGTGFSTFNLVKKLLKTPFVAFKTDIKHLQVIP